MCAVLPAEAWFPRGAGGLAAGQAEARVPVRHPGHQLPLHPATPRHTLGDRGGVEQGMLQTQHQV